ncbi:MAG: c-type cytochrome, partial [Nitrospinota bacterium]
FRRAWGAALLVTLASVPAVAMGPEAARGRKLVGELGCPVCHEIRGQGTTAPREAPDLSREGEKVRPGWLFDFLRKPHNLRPWLKARMPNFRLSEREALAITEFIMTLKGPQWVATKTDAGKPVPGDRLAEGEKLFDLLECAQCHPAGGERKGDVEVDALAPDFALAAKRLQPEWVLRWLKDPQAIQPGTKMPTYFSEEDEEADEDDDGEDEGEAEDPEDKSGILTDKPERKIRLLRDYLLSLSPQSSKRKDYAEARERFPQVGPAGGETLVRELNCGGCHKFPQLGAGEKVGPVLDREGSRVKKAWLRKFLKSPKPLRLTLIQRMPDFRLTDEDASDLTEFLASMVDGNVPEKLFAKGKAPRALILGGKRLIKESLGCLVCHRIGEQGAYGAPELTHGGRRLKAGWIYGWIKNPKHFQPQTPMPRVELSDEEARRIAAYLSSLP